MSESNQLYSFDINTASLERDLESQLNHYRQRVDALLQQPSFNWDNLMTPLADLDHDFNRFWTPASHLNSVKNTEDIRKSYNQCIPKISAFFSDMNQNKQLFSAIQQINDNADNLSQAQQTILNHDIRDFTLSGVNLSKDKKQEFKNLTTHLSILSTKFEENVLDATEAWSKLITNEEDLAGLPDYAIKLTKQFAEQKNKRGYLLTLQIPCYVAVMQYADNRDLRKEMYQAYCTRASDQGPNAHEFDNSSVMVDILTTRNQLAKLLDFDHYAQYSLATKMIKQPKRVLDFLWELVDKSYAHAQQDKANLVQFAKEQLQLESWEPWDMGYVSEKLKQQHYSISDQELRPYFPAPQVVSGLFDIVQRLFNIHIEAIADFDRWHNDVACYVIKNEQGGIISYFYMDLYTREKKRGGAWMNDAQTRQIDGKHIQHLPIAFIVCNFNPPIGDNPALLSHDEVVTLFHEFGHSLQLMLTEIDYAGVSGLNGIPWDAVEVCSQFLENWAWQKECMPLISSHVDTGEPLPDTLFDRMTRARLFQSGMQMLRQLEFSLFDFLLHVEFDPTKDNQIQSILNTVREKTTVFPVPDYHRFQHGFSHIFAGGYAAGYYSYKWAEVMAADAFSQFIEKGIFDKDTSDRFRQTFLASGGAIEPLDLFVDFAHREPRVDALLQQYGIL